MKNKKQILLSLVVGAGIGLSIQATQKDNLFEISKNLEVMANVFKELNENYVDPLEPGKMMKTGLGAMLQELDPYTNLITEADISDYEFQTTGKYGGIGAGLMKRDDKVLIGDIYENSPSQKAGLHPGDELLKVDGKSIAGKEIDDIIQILKGAPGTSLSIEIIDINTGKTEIKNLVRGEIEISSVPYAALVGPNREYAYAVLTQFTPGCSRLLQLAYDSLQKAQPQLKGVILDLRNNPGGLLDEAVKVCNLFVDRGQLVVTTKGKTADANKEFHTQGTSWNTNIPVAVLINQSSASASEIVSGTIQDLDRGVVIGSKSYGKGLVQTTKPVGYNARIKLTTAKYYTPSGRCIQSIDYSSRDDKGKATTMHDSLQKTFTTKAGRKVKSGGGVTPDLVTSRTEYSPITATLYSKNLIFAFANDYAKKNPKIAPATEFKVDDATFLAFQKFIENKDYAYKTQTQYMLDSLQSAAKQEKYFDAVKTEISALEKKLAHDQKQDLIKHKDEVVDLLENEIVSRYYYQKGRIQQGLKDDQDLKKAFETLSNQATYKSILSKK